jgi:hypothetical protein
VESTNAKERTEQIHEKERNTIAAAKVPNRNAAAHCTNAAPVRCKNAEKADCTTVAASILRDWSSDNSVKDYNSAGHSSNLNCLDPNSHNHAHSICSNPDSPRIVNCCCQILLRADDLNDLNLRCWNHYSRTPRALVRDLWSFAAQPNRDCCFRCSSDCDWPLNLPVHFACATAVDQFAPDSRRLLDDCYLRCRGFRSRGQVPARALRHFQ